MRVGITANLKKSKLYISFRSFNNQQKSSMKSVCPQVKDSEYDMKLVRSG